VMPAVLHQGDHRSRYPRFPGHEHKPTPALFITQETCVMKAESATKHPSS
jgi:hypothetical protein